MFGLYKIYFTFALLGGTLERQIFKKICPSFSPYFNKNTI